MKRLLLAEPRATLFTFIPKAGTSLARLLVKTVTAALVAQKKTPFATPILPPLDNMLITLPSLRGII